MDPQIHWQVPQPVQLQMRVGQQLPMMKTLRMMDSDAVGGDGGGGGDAAEIMWWSLTVSL
jgi:hypothetical protein